MDLKSFLASLDRKEKEIEVLGQKMIIKEMTAKESGDYQTAIFNRKTNVIDVKKAETLLICYCLYDLDGNRVYGLNDIGLIESLPSSVVKVLSSEAQNLNKDDLTVTEKN